MLQQYSGDFPGRSVAAGIRRSRPEGAEGSSRFRGLRAGAPVQPPYGKSNEADGDQRQECERVAAHCPQNAGGHAGCAPPDEDLLAGHAAGSSGSTKSTALPAGRQKRSAPVRESRTAVVTAIPRPALDCPERYRRNARAAPSTTYHCAAQKGSGKPVPQLRRPSSRRSPRAELRPSPPQQPPRRPHGAVLPKSSAMPTAAASASAAAATHAVDVCRETRNCGQGRARPTRRRPETTGARGQLPAGRTVPLAHHIVRHRPRRDRAKAHRRPRRPGFRLPPPGPP